MKVSYIDVYIFILFHSVITRREYLVEYYLCGSHFRSPIFSESYLLGGERGISCGMSLDRYDIWNMTVQTLAWPEDRVRRRLSPQVFFNVDT